ncbi:YqcC family protein [Vibrio penaeicida]|uniref:YqcC family protein n=1 Tax=Vibrio penaeicida TaxID=104609 RepID=UPI000CEA1366|nr:YqcC family protein [Vibrio penaeicida]
MNTARISILIENLKTALQQENLWESTPPSSEALASQQPFAYDTLEPHQWLQWIFITRLEAMISASQPLPSALQLLPYFEEVWKDDASKIKVLAAISDFDEAFASC